MSLTKSHDVASLSDWRLDFRIKPRRPQFRTPMWRRNVQSHLRATTFSAVASLLMATCASAGTPDVDPDLELVSAWGGPVNSVAFDGDIAYVGSGRRLVILDVANLNNFIELGSVVLGNTVQDLAVRDGLAYVLTRDEPQPFSVVDISNPSAPQIIWTSGTPAPWGSTEPAKIEFRGEYAYIRGSGGADDDGDILVVSLANPAVPAAPIVAVSGVVNSFNDFAINGDLMFLASRTSSDEFGAPVLHIHDLGADPVHPPLIGSLEMPLPGSQGDLELLTAAGNYVYALAEYTWPEFFVNLAVIDVSSARKPVLLTPIAPSFSTSTVKHGIAAANGRLFVAAGADPGHPSPSGWADSEGLIIYDIAANPAAPTVIRNYKTHGSIFGVHPVGNRAWLFDAGEGLIAVDVSNPLNPVRKDNYHSPAFLTGLAKRNDRLFVADIWNGFSILDVAKPSAPQLMGVYQTPLTPPPFGKGDPSNYAVNNLDIEVRDNLVYLVTGRAGIHAVNVANPANPIKAGATALLPENQTASAIELDGPHAHLGIDQTPCCGWYHNYLITDVSQPIVLPLAGSVEVSDGPTAIATRQGHSYLALAFGGLQVVGTIDPTGPQLVDAASDAAAVDLVLADDLLCIADKSPADSGGGLKLYDLGDRDTLEFEGYYAGGIGSAVAVQNDRAYLVTYGDLFAFDISNPAQPQPLAVEYYVGYLSNNTLLADEPNIYLAAAHDSDRQASHAIGLTVFAISGCLESAGDADLNCDGHVNGYDLAHLLSAWTGSGFYSPCPPHIPADLSHDCRINATDVAVLLGSWG